MPGDKSGPAETGSTGPQMQAHCASTQSRRETPAYFTTQMQTRSCSKAVQVQVKIMGSTGVEPNADPGYCCHAPDKSPIYSSLAGIRCTPRRWPITHQADPVLLSGWSGWM
jgi:hypothetical protein